MPGLHPLREAVNELRRLERESQVDGRFGNAFAYKRWAAAAELGLAALETEPSPKEGVAREILRQLYNSSGMVGMPDNIAYLNALNMAREALRLPLLDPRHWPRPGQPRDDSFTDAYIAPGTAVRYDGLVQGGPEFGIVVHCWLDPQIEGYDCYVAFVGSAIPDGAPKERPYLLRYSATSLARLVGLPREDS